MEIFPDVLVHRLKMIVDPADSSYMPSLVVVSGMCMFSKMSKKKIFLHPTAGIYLVFVNIVICLIWPVHVCETNTIS